MITFRPGSWKVRDYDPAFPNEAFVDIACGYIEIGGSSVGRDAVARLIATAPDLLVMLITVLDDLQEHREFGGQMPATELQAIRDVIAKAQGEGT